MDRAAIEELFTFTDHSWGVYERSIRPLGDGMLTQPAPGSGWPALRDALVHINWAYIRWLADPTGTTHEPVERIESWDKLEAYRSRVRGHAHDYLDSLNDEKLSTPQERTSTASRSGTAPRTSSRTPCCTNANTTGI